MGLELSNFNSTLTEQTLASLEKIYFEAAFLFSCQRKRSFRFFSNKNEKLKIFADFYEVAKTDKKKHLITAAPIFCFFCQGWVSGSSKAEPKNFINLPFVALSIEKSWRHWCIFYYLWLSLENTDLNDTKNFTRIVIKLTSLLHREQRGAITASWQHWPRLKRLI